MRSMTHTRRGFLAQTAGTMFGAQSPSILVHEHVLVNFARAKYDPDAVFAIDMVLGTVRWRTQVTERDNFVMGCGPKSVSGNCPTPMGPDYDFGSTPILFTLKNGRQILLAGQKSGV